MKGGLKPHYSSLQPFLTEQNKYSCLLYALERVNPNDTTKFMDIYDFIHVDEKWFYLTRNRQQFLLAEEEIPPQCCVSHKGHITKVMFVSALVFPCYDTRLNRWWDGKLSIWPIGTWELAKQKTWDWENQEPVWKNKVLTGFYPKVKSFLACSHMNCCQHYMLHINLHILYILFIKLNFDLKEFQVSNNYFKRYQENKMNLYLNLNLHSNLNVK